LLLIPLLLYWYSCVRY